jgi:vanadium chloroperoxidase
VPYQHAADPFSPGQSFAGASWGSAQAFLSTMTLQPLDPPAGRTGPSTFTPNAFYAAEFEEVVKHGALHASSRTAREEETAIYWAYDGAEEIGTPPRLYMQVTLTVLDARAQPLNSRQLLEALSACAVAMCDAGIQAWHYKYDAGHMLWRPVLGIRNAQPLPMTPADPSWVPLGKPETNTRHIGTTPDFPAYPSGHATFGAACFHTLRRFIRKHEALGFGDGDVDPIAFTFVSDEYNGRNTDPRDGLPRRHVSRRHSSLWEAIRDNSESRIFLGVHWRMDGISKLDAGGHTVHGRPAKPADVGRMGGVFLGLGIAKVVATARGF